MPADNNKGFTLVEMIIAIVLGSFAILILATTLFPRSMQSVEQVYAIRAADLGRAILNEIAGRNYDQNSGPNGGLPECNNLAAGGIACTAAAALGPDAGELNRDDFNDVDDFNGFSGNIENVLDEDLAAEYPRYQADISVFYDADLNGVADAASGDRKQIQVVITDPNGQQYPFAVIRGNF